MPEHQMHSMKIDKKDMPKPEPVGEEYGYGMTIHLESSQVEKLGLGSLEPGKKVEIHALAEVVSSNISKSKGENRHSMTLQITDMGAGPAADTSETATALYGKG